MPRKKGSTTKGELERTYSQTFSTSLPTRIMLLQLAQLDKERFADTLRRKTETAQISPVLEEMITTAWERAVADGLINPDNREWMEVARQAFVKARLVEPFDAGQITDDKLNPLTLKRAS